MERISKILANRKADILNDIESTRAAVLLPLMEHQGKLAVLFEVRSHKLLGQPGEICFPGGHMEEQDANPCKTAIRETSEELGINPEEISVIGALDILVPPFNLILYPYVGKIESTSILKPANDEVAEIFFVPLDYLCQAEPTVSYTSLETIPIPDFPTHLLPNGKSYNWRRGLYPVYFYCYEKYVIWGLTARILHHFLTLIR